MKHIYSSQQIKQIDQLAAQYLGINSFELMQKAGASIYTYIQHEPEILVVAGLGNNAGDGFIIAEMAIKQGNKAIVWSLESTENLPTDAQQAASQYLKAGGQIIYDQPSKKQTCIVDAIFGTGLSRDIEGNFAKAIGWMNLQKAKIIAVDIPSGLDADTGVIRGCAVKADITVSVICYKAGLVTNNGKDQCGQLFLEDLQIPGSAFKTIKPYCQLLDRTILKQPLFKRINNSHKGSFGKALVVGGHDGMLGALILAGKATLYSGCGMVEIVSNTQDVIMACINCPELITANNIKASRFLNTADVIAVGPGLGLNQQSKEVLETCITQQVPMVIDADALTLIAEKKPSLVQTILTPHPKEAASLLNSDIDTIQADRIAAAIEISQRYQATIILKGSGTIIASKAGDVSICPYGYAGMATAGMGDVLTGIVAGLMTQGFSPFNAAKTAVVWHALTAENCKKGNCLVASDVISQLNKLI
jgi:NAD(P)H-hydrate epimerase